MNTPHNKIYNNPNPIIKEFIESLTLGEAAQILRLKNLDKWRARQRRAQKRYRLKYPEKARARDKLSTNIRRGKILKKPCEVCGESKVEGHHSDYEKALKITWFCKKHHRAWHRLFLCEGEK